MIPAKRFGFWEYVMRTILVAAAIVTACSASTAVACSAPSMYATPPSSPSSLSKPSAPYCMSGYSYSRKHTCDENEIRSYLDEIDEYVEKLVEFSREANEFAREAVEFANSSSTYAKCARDDVMSDLE